MIFLNILLACIAAIALVMIALALMTRTMAGRVEKALPPRGRFIDVPGARLHISEQGEGLPIVLLHGLAGHMAHYTYGVAERLAREYRVIVVDRPGSGYSVRHEGSPADLATQADAIAALIDKLQLEPALVVGHSLGGALALTLALNHPQRVKGLALVAPLTDLPGDVPAAFKALTIASPMMRKLVAWTMAAPMTAARGHVVLEQVFGPEPVPADFATRGGGLLSLRPAQYLSAAQDLQALPDAMPGIVSRYNELRIPIGVLYGEKDRILSSRTNGEGFVQKVPHATLKLVQGGHMLPVTQAQLTADFISEMARQAFTATETSHG
jgi:pimeloyl-ACP methyl ester carboxylesterase